MVKDDNEWRRGMLAKCVKAAAGECVSVIKDVKVTLDSRRKVEKSRFVIVPMAGRRAHKPLTTRRSI